MSAQQRSTSAPWGIGHNNEIEIEVPILKEANAETLGNSASMHTRLSHSKYGTSCGRSCRKGRLMSINTKDGGQGGDDSTDVFLSAGWKFRYGRFLSRQRSHTTAVRAPLRPMRAPRGIRNPFGSTKSDLASSESSYSAAEHVHRAR